MSADEGEIRTGPIMDALRAPLLAVAFLTRIPCPRWVGGDAAQLARSTAYFPLVGVVVGVVGAAAYVVAAMIWTPLVAAVLSTAATVRLTGAFHEDALADACDGLGGGWERAQVLTIMKNSRIGSYGTVGLALTLIARVAALAMLGDADVAMAARALVVGHVLGRWSSLPLIWALPYVSETGAKSRAFEASVTRALLPPPAWRHDG